MSETAVTVWSKIPHLCGEKSALIVRCSVFSLGGSYAPLAKDEIGIVFP